MIKRRGRGAHFFVGGPSAFTGVVVLVVGGISEGGDGRVSDHTFLLTVVIRDWLECNVPLISTPVPLRTAVSCLRGLRVHGDGCYD